MENKLGMDKVQAEKALQINLKYAKLSQPYLKKDGVTTEIRMSYWISTKKRKRGTKSHPNAGTNQKGERHSGKEN